MATSLSSFLSTIRSNVLRQGQHASSIAPRSCTIVMGNSSADLDSFISAVVFSYFYSRRARCGSSSSSGPEKDHVYIPLLNLPAVAGSELWRLRPEYGAALRLATQAGGGDEEEEDSGTNESADEIREKDKKLLENLITVADITSSKSSMLYSTFAESAANSGSSGKVDPFSAARATHEKQEVILVDHNAPAVSHLSTSELEKRIKVVGCIDHHVDESYVSPSALPRIIKTGIGSCTSLVVQHLRDEKMWPEFSASASTSNPSPSVSSTSTDPINQASSSSSSSELMQIAKLALAPILIDTSNLTAPGDKCSELDREAVKFLESHIPASSSPPWDRQQFFHTISHAKAHSLDLLTLPEILSRDYKEWTEMSSSSSSSTPIHLGISSLVRPLSWLLSHAAHSDPEQLIAGIRRFAADTKDADGNPIALLGLIAKGNDDGPDRKYRKELAVIALEQVAVKAIEVFEEKATEELKLTAWNEDQVLVNALEAAAFGGSESGSGSDAKNEKGNEDGQGKMDRGNVKACKVWWQGDVSKSRKQVAPLLREAARSS